MIPFIVALRIVAAFVNWSVARCAPRRPPVPRQPPAPRSTALVVAPQRAVWDPSTVSNLAHDAVTRELRPIWLAKRPYDFNEAELAAWYELAAAFDDDYKQQG
jgi:1-acyl-sn-glycerol-3-phosphate acyltransferase